MKKDLTLYSGSPMSRLYEIGRFGDIFGELDKIWKNWDFDMKTFIDMQPKTSFPKVNVSETADQYEVEVALAGFNKEDISMELKDNCLYIKADKKEQVSDEDVEKKYLMNEISYRSFRRAINIPAKIMTDNIECSHKDGIVKCILKKEVAVEKKDNTINIEIN